MKSLNNFLWDTELKTDADSQQENTFSTMNYACKEVMVCCCTSGGGGGGYSGQHNTVSTGGMNGCK